jgi:hypothetical protein
LRRVFGYVIEQPELNRPRPVFGYDIIEEAIMLLGVNFKWHGASRLIETETVPRRGLVTMGERRALLDRLASQAGFSTEEAFVGDVPVRLWRGGMYNLLRLASLIAEEAANAAEGEMIQGDDLLTSEQLATNDKIRRAIDRIRVKFKL